VCSGIERLSPVCRDPTQIPWDKAGAEYVIESTGAFTSLEKVDPSASI